MDDRCSFCCLQKETVSECTPTVYSSQSTPTEERLSQVQYNADKIECQAENYLNALFRKKDLPQNCDPNIPLVAQELMKKMIRQFAIEYVSKSRKIQESRNGSFISNHTCNGVKMNQTLVQEEQDGPLDLTVSRTGEQNMKQGDGVLDLSTKKASLCSEKMTTLDSSYESPLSRLRSRLDPNLSQSREVLEQKKGTALKEVLNSLCRYHQQQILKMLKFLLHGKNVCSLICNCTKSHVNPQNQSSVSQVEGLICSSIEHRHTRRCRLKNIKPALKPLSICIKNLRLSCKTVNLGSFKTFLNQGLCDRSNLLNCCERSMKKSSLARKAFPSVACDVSKNIKRCNRTTSPSPPKLSPAEIDHSENVKQIVEEPSACETNRLESSISRPPPLLPVDGYSACNLYNSYTFPHTDVQGNRQSLNKETFDKSDNVIFQDLLDRFNEKLNSIETHHLEIPTDVLKYSNFQKPEHQGKHGEHIKCFVQNSRASDYNFMKLLGQEEKNMESASIRTRFRNRQRALLSKPNSPHSCFSKRQSLQTKRDYGESCVRKISVLGKTAKIPKMAVKLTRGQRFEEVYWGLENTGLSNPMNNLNLPPKSKSVCLQKCDTQMSKLSCPGFEGSSKSIQHFENSSAVTIYQGTSSIAHKNKRKAQKYLEHAAIEKINAFKDNGGKVFGRTKNSMLGPMGDTEYVPNHQSVKQQKYVHLENTKFENSLEGKRYMNMDLNKLAKITHVQVVVERLEDTVHLGNKKFTAPSSLGKCKMSKKQTKDTLGGNKKSCRRQFNHGTRARVNLIQYPSSDDESTIKTVSGNTLATNHMIMEESLHCGSGVLTTNCEGRKMRSKTWEHPAYASPIKLMFVSQVGSKEGAKYILTSFDLSSTRNVSFYLFKRSTELEAMKTLGKMAKERTNPLCTQGSTAMFNEPITEESRMCDREMPITGKTENQDCNESEESMDASSSMEKSDFKRKPGRPKKIGPQNVKHIKRPIGRPPKPKMELTGSVDRKNEPHSTDNNGRCDVTATENINNANIIVTVVFGRSRRTRRHVLEDKINSTSTAKLHHISFNSQDKHLPHISAKGNTLHEIYAAPSPDAENISENSYDHFGPIKERPGLHYPIKNINHPNEMSATVIRKPGRPQKVKISGISVTVNRLSSQKRTVSLNSSMSSQDQKNVVEHTLYKEKPQVCKSADIKDCTKRCSPRFGSHDANNLISTKGGIKLRQSVRTKIPSAIFLHAVASSSAFSPKRALLHRSCKHQLSEKKTFNNKSNKSIVNQEFKHTPEIIESTSIQTGGAFNTFGSVFEVSADSIFQPHNALKWWTASASKDTLLEELNNRFEQMAETWLEVDENKSKKHISIKREPTEQKNALKVLGPMRNCLSETELSPVKMLFKKKCDMKAVCSWFMQTTETKSIIMGRKENTHCSLEVISNRKSKKGIQKADSSSQISVKQMTSFVLPSEMSGKSQLQPKEARYKDGCKGNNKIALVQMRTKMSNSSRKRRWKSQSKTHIQQSLAWNSKIKNPTYVCQSKKEVADNETNTWLQEKNTLEVQEPHLNNITECCLALLPQKMQLQNLNNLGNISDFCKPDKDCQVNKHFDTAGKACKANEASQSMYHLESVQDCRVFLKKIRSSKERECYQTNKVFSLPKPVKCLSNQRRHKGEIKRWTLRSHSNQHNMENKSPRFKNLISKSLGNLTKMFHEKVSAVPRSSTNRLVNDSEIPKGNTKGKRCRQSSDIEDLKLAKRQKKQSCKSTSHYSDLQPGPVIPVGLPMLRGLKSRNVEYSMTPFRMPFHGGPQQARQNS
ncbi:ligand-dependent nuclear receptor corepressor-like protein isoform X2 [Lissotriton helveticus]